jgi:ADP-ribose pyrophosphatase YjhB (NUDIX family)
MHEGENPEDACVREVAGEVGLKVVSTVRVCTRNSRGF